MESMHDRLAGDTRNAGGLRRLVATALVLAALALRPAAAPRQSPAPSGDRATSGAVTTPDGVRLHYEVRGSPGDTIVVLHGGPGLSSAYLAPDLDLLAGDHRLVHYDQRGAGRSTVLSDEARLTLEHHVADVEAVRLHFGLERLVLLGHSWGAAPAAFYARAHPDRVARLILLDPVPARRTPYMEQFGRNLRAWMDEATAERVGALAAARATAVDPVSACRDYWRVFIRGYMADPNAQAVLARMKGDVCDAPPAALANGGVVYRAALGALGDWDWREAMRSVRVPVLIVHGDRDPIPIASAAEWRDAFPSATLVSIEGAGHFPYLEQPAAVRSAIETCLSDGRTSGGR